MASKTMSLDPQEWRALVISNIVLLHHFVTTGTAAPNDKEGEWLMSQFDRLKFQVGAWQASSRPVEPILTHTIPMTTAIPSMPKPDVQTTNGSHAPKKRGRPKGSVNKDKKRRQPLTATQ